MAKSTKDCVNFLIQCAKDGKLMEVDTLEKMLGVTTAKYWKRMSKHKTPEAHYKSMGLPSDWNPFGYYNPPIKKEDIVSIRVFQNVLEVNCERQIYELFEMKDGTLILGDNFGD